MSSTNVNFLYRYKFPSRKENLYPVFKSCLASAGSQWPLAQKNNPYAKEAYLGLACSHTPHGETVLMRSEKQIIFLNCLSFTRWQTEP